MNASEHSNKSTALTPPPTTTTILDLANLIDNLDPGLFQYFLRNVVKPPSEDLYNLLMFAANSTNSAEWLASVPSDQLVDFYVGLADFLNKKAKETSIQNSTTRKF
jgi:hypothetical protein